ncbi:Aldehyde dehydrogenase B [Escherichia coli]|nr:Aldehyde dehydrogenase B [Escherichia coli]
MEQNLELLATAETWDNGKPIRETSAADVPLAIDIFAISPRVFGRRKVGSVKLIAKPWPIISMNR